MTQVFNTPSKPPRQASEEVIIWDESHLANVCATLISPSAKITAAERKLISSPSVADRALARLVAREIRDGGDPLGDAFISLRSAIARRGSGAVYTPAPIVKAMMEWVAAGARPSRVVDAGAGSGRFILEAGRQLPKARLIAAEMDPLAALMLRANLEVRGWTRRSEVLVGDYRTIELPKERGATAFIGNPPYVRHHDIAPEWKAWYSSRFKALGIKASGLAGLHLHFFLQTYLLAREGDYGTFITSAEWMDVNYGSALRKLLQAGLGGTALHVLTPEVEAFPGTATTAAITCFKIGESQAPIRVRSVSNLRSLKALDQGKLVPRARFDEHSKWSILVRPARAELSNTLELGELFSVHRGQVTGKNSVWISGEHAAALPDRFKIPTVTKARDLLLAGEILRSSDRLRRVVDLPASLDALHRGERTAVERFLAWAAAQGADKSYVATHRRAWWSVGLREPAPILCTYMARRPPQFTLNQCGARHINIAHGLYPRGPIAADTLERIVAWLNTNTHRDSGRTYAGGLTKFEPREIERIRIPVWEDNRA